LFCRFLLKLFEIIGFSKYRFEEIEIHKQSHPFLVSLLADNDKTVTNSMLLEMIELYQKMNDTRFERIRSAIRKVKEQGFLLPQSLATC